MPVVPGAWTLALRVPTSFDVVKNAAVIAIAKAVAKMAKTVRWLMIVPSERDLNGLSGAAEAVLVLFS
jgi:hypothetical protein